MNNLSYEKLLSEFFQTWQSMLNSANTAAHILSRMSEDIRKIQSDAGTAWITETPSTVAPPFSPEDSVHALWQVPTQYHSQARRMMNALLNTGSILSRAQQELREWGIQAYSESIERTTQAMSGLVGAVASRRVTANVINFADRRARGSSETGDAGDVNDSGQTRSSQRPSHQAQG